MLFLKSVLKPGTLIRLKVNLGLIIPSKSIDGGYDGKVTTCPELNSICEVIKQNNFGTLFVWFPVEQIFVAGLSPTFFDLVNSNEQQE